jgi:hypothetical protein
MLRQQQPDPGRTVQKLLQRKRPCPCGYSGLHRRPDRLHRKLHIMTSRNDDSEVSHDSFAVDKGRLGH